MAKAMIDIILCCIITALFCNGLQIATSKGMILEFVRLWLDSVFFIDQELIEENDKPVIKKHYRKIYYPILHCIKCMPSIYGTMLAFLFFPFTLSLLWQIPVIIICSCCLSALVFQYYD